MKYSSFDKVSLTMNNDNTTTLNIEYKVNKNKSQQEIDAIVDDFNKIKPRFIRASPNELEILKDFLHYMRLAYYIDE